jgi:hypothetical protein
MRSRVGLTYGDGGDGACRTSSTCCGGLLYVDVAGSAAGRVATASTAGIPASEPVGATGGGDSGHFTAGVGCEHAAIAATRREYLCEVVRSIARH